jgi:hypothetical protein
MMLQPPQQTWHTSHTIFRKNIIQALTKADKRKPRQSGEPFGHCEVCHLYKNNMNVLHCINMHFSLIMCMFYICSITIIFRISPHKLAIDTIYFIFYVGPSIYLWLSFMHLLILHFFSSEALQKLAILLSLVSMYNQRLVYDKTYMTYMCINNCYALQMFYVLLYPYVSKY